MTQALLHLFIASGRQSFSTSCKFTALHDPVFISVDHLREAVIVPLMSFESYRRQRQITFAVARALRQRSVQLRYVTLLRYTAQLMKLDKRLTLTEFGCDIKPVWPTVAVNDAMVIRCRTFPLDDPLKHFPLHY